jgi:hypothetical protein
MELQWQKLMIGMVTTAGNVARNGDIGTVLGFMMNPGAAGMAIGAAIAQGPASPEDIAADEIRARFKLGLTGQDGFSREDLTASHGTILPLATDLDQATAALAGTNYEVIELKDEFASLRSAATSFTTDLVNGFLQGESAVDTFGRALDDIASRLIGGGLDMLFGAILPAPGSVSIPMPNLRPFGGARAGGGSVSPSKSYVVGEYGPELFSPGSAGMITPAGGGAGKVTVNYAPAITVQGNADPRAIDSMRRALIADMEERLPAMIHKGRMNRRMG